MRILAKRANSRLCNGWSVDLRRDAWIFWTVAILGPDGFRPELDSLLRARTQGIFSYPGYLRASHNPLIPL